MSSSSDEEDELDASKLAALRSVAIDSAVVVQNASAPTPSHRMRNSGKPGNSSSDALMTEDSEGKESSGLKLYQTRLQDLLYKHLDQTVGKCFDDPPLAPETSSLCQSEATEVDDGCSSGLRLFGRAPPGIVVLRPEQSQVLTPRVKPRLLQALTLNEDSQEHHIRLQAVVVDGKTVREQASRMTARILASAQASQAAIKQAAKSEEERVALLKRERGEEWLPNIAAQMGKQVKVSPLSEVVPKQTTNGVSTKKKKKKKKKKGLESSELVKGNPQNVGVDAQFLNEAQETNTGKLTGKILRPQVGTVLD